MNIPIPSLKEIDELIARFTSQRARWHGEPGYARGLDIEIMALQLLKLLRTPATVTPFKSE